MAGGIFLSSHELEQPDNITAVIYSRLHCVKVVKAQMLRVIMDINHRKIFKPQFVQSLRDKFRLKNSVGVESHAAFVANRDADIQTAPRS